MDSHVFYPNNKKIIVTRALLRIQTFIYKIAPTFAHRMKALPFICPLLS